MRNRTVTAAVVAVMFGLIPVAAQGDLSLECPPIFSAHYQGTFQSESSGTFGQIIGDITNVDGQLTGVFEKAGGGTSEWTATANCDQVAADLVDETQTIHFDGIFAADGRSLAGTYTTTLGPDNGTFSIEVSAPSESVAVGELTVFEGDTTGGTLAFRTQAAATTAVRARPRIVYVPISLSLPSPARQILSWRLIGDSAEPGIDYVDDGTIHMKRLRPGVTILNVPVVVIPNNVRDGNRQLAVEVTTSPFAPFAKVGVLTIADDD